MTEEKDKKDRMDFLKLCRESMPVEVRIKEDKVPCYMHVLTHTEQMHSDTVYLEAQELSKTGTDQEKVNVIAFWSQAVQRLFYALRITSDPMSKRLFEDAREVSALPADEINRLNTIYRENFELSEDDLGNSLRARISIS